MISSTTKHRLVLQLKYDSL